MERIKKLKFLIENTKYEHSKKYKYRKIDQNTKITIEVLQSNKGFLFYVVQNKECIIKGLVYFDIIRRYYIIDEKTSEELDNLWYGNTELLRKMYSKIRSFTV